MIVTPRVLLAPQGLGPGMLLNTHVQVALHREWLGTQCPWGRPYLGTSLLGQSSWTCQPDPQGRGPFIHGGYVLSAQCSSSIVPANAPKLIRDSELPTCPTQFSPARLGMQ